MAASCVHSITLIEPRRSACQAYKDEHAAAGSTTQLTLIPGCAEVELACLEAGTFDLIMTSPPYYNTELYLQSPGDGEQAHSKFKSLEDFKTGFLAVLLQESAWLLRPEGVLALNIDNSAEAPRYVSLFWIRHRGMGCTWRARSASRSDAGPASRSIS
eukprot:COSAG01_NODE_1206_length_11242_cov_29.405905_10_plen_158_part_00